jgi:hypothetical protein
VTHTLSDYEADYAEGYALGTGIATELDLTRVRHDPRQYFLTHSRAHYRGYLTAVRDAFEAALAAVKFDLAELEEGRLEDTYREAERARETLAEAGHEAPAPDDAGAGDDTAGEPDDDTPGSVDESAAVAPRPRRRRRRGGEGEG